MFAHKRKYTPDFVQISIVKTRLSLFYKENESIPIHFKVFDIT